MRKTNREFTEEVFLRSENLISKRKTFRKKVILLAACLALLILIVPMQILLGGASGGSSSSHDETNGAVQQEWKGQEEATGIGNVLEDTLNSTARDTEEQHYSAAEKSGDFEIESDDAETESEDEETEGTVDRLDGEEEDDE